MPKPATHFASARPRDSVFMGVLISALIALACAALWPAPAAAQSGPSPQDPDLINRVDSLKRAITKRILSDADKKEIRSCDREKAQFLKQCRTSDSAFVQVDRQLTDAKLHGVDPNDPSVQTLLEKKFTFEKACDDRYTATPKGKQCTVDEEKRRAALDKALAQDKPYQSLLKKLEAKSDANSL